MTWTPEEMRWIPAERHEVLEWLADDMLGEGRLISGPIRIWALAHGLDLDNPDELP